MAEDVIRLQIQRQCLLSMQQKQDLYCFNKLFGGEKSPLILP